MVGKLGQAVATHLLHNVTESGLIGVAIAQRPADESCQAAIYYCPSYINLPRNLSVLQRGWPELLRL